MHCAADTLIYHQFIPCKKEIGENVNGFLSQSFSFASTGGSAATFPISASGRMKNSIQFLPWGLGQWDNGQPRCIALHKAYTNKAFRQCVLAGLCRQVAGEPARNLIPHGCCISTSPCQNRVPLLRVVLKKIRQVVHDTVDLAASPPMKRWKLTA